MQQIQGLLYACLVLNLHLRHNQITPANTMKPLPPALTESIRKDVAGAYMDSIISMTSEHNEKHSSDWSLLEEKKATWSIWPILTTHVHLWYVTRLLECPQNFSRLSRGMRSSNISAYCGICWKISDTEWIATSLQTLYLSFPSCKASRDTYPYIYTILEADLSRSAYARMLDGGCSAVYSRI